MESEISLDSFSQAMDETIDMNEVEAVSKKSSIKREKVFDCSFFGILTVTESDNILKIALILDYSRKRRKCSQKTE